MKAGKTREEIVEIIKFDMQEISKKRKEIEEVLGYLEDNHDIKRGALLSYFTDINKVTELPTEELALLGEQLSIKLNKDSKFLNEYYTDEEIKRLRVYKQPNKKKKVELKFKPAIKLSDKVYIVPMSREQIAMLYENGTFVWDENVQREGNKKQHGDTIITVPKLNWSNIEEIKQQALDGILMENELAYNCVLGSSPEGQEVYYNENTNELALADEFLGQILDGMHRTVGIAQAWRENPNIEGYMPVRISNYTTKEAARYQVELSKAVPVDKSRIRELSKEKLTDEIVDVLKLDGDLKGKISSKTVPTKKMGELVSYKVISDAFSDSFEVKNRLQAIELAEEFNQYLMYLFGYFEDELNDKNSLLFDNRFFYMHVYLFKKLKEQNIDLKEIKNIIKPELFHRDNKQLEEYKIRVPKLEASYKGIKKFVNDILLKGSE